MKRIVCILGAVSALAVAASASAQAAPTFVFTTIDAVRRQGNATLFLAGVQEGASTASEVQLYGPTSSTNGLDSCERYALLSMEKPGRYRLEIWRHAGPYDECRLSRVNP